MTQSLLSETFTDQSRDVELATNHPVVADCDVPRIKRTMDARVAVLGRVGSSAISHCAAIVFVAEGDICVRESLELPIRDASWQLETFESTKEFLSRERVLVPSCLILDLESSGLDGLDLQNLLAAEWEEMPIIFVTDHRNVEMTVQAMKAGAFDLFTKPFRDDVLLSAVRQAIEHSRTALAHAAEIRELQDCYTCLSRREKEVMSLVVSGLLNKQVGFELDVSEITVKAHRGHVMQKMKAGSFADLVKMAVKLGVSPAGASRFSQLRARDAHKDIDDIIAR